MKNKNWEKGKKRKKISEDVENNTAVASAGSDYMQQRLLQVATLVAATVAAAAITHTEECMSAGGGTWKLYPEADEIFVLKVYFKNKMH